ncbi:MAG TPA: 2-oxoglutarate dehydrogenase complex dihydrolipoyllysine-residue succinyltransferase [Prolixibacteraceae bacterium]|nr:2-oxoglutarate dehydrogenase complex dihydrolipoyllysine-residue succinyltransferase [Prolixibacteraceae bacterium]
MIFEIKIPSPGESITEVEIGKWLVENGSIVKKDQEIAEIESDKATLSLTASAAGKLNILLKEGERVAVGTVVCTLDSDETVKPTESDSILLNKLSVQKPEVVKVSSHPVPDSKPSEIKLSSPEEENHQIKLTPAAKAVMEEEGLSIDDLLNGLRRISRKDVELVLTMQKNEPSKPIVENTRDEDRVAMSPLRRKLSQRLVAVKNETAMLTTFNEIDMSQVMELRKAYQESFVEKYKIKLGFMSFFTKAVSIALSKHPSINSMIDSDIIVTPRYHDIGIAVQTPKGLMVPIIRNAETKSIEGIEREIKELAEKARDRKLTIQEMTGGTFTITNGGVFGSLMSTPILNPPQSAILGMHSIKDRPIAVNGKVEIRPMMYVALSYDHRIIDGKDSVGFLVNLKELIEDPAKLLFDGKNPEEQLLGL